jgi:hypothetical protein
MMLLILLFMIFVVLTISLFSFLLFKNSKIKNAVLKQEARYSLLLRRDEVFDSGQIDGG